MKYIIAILNSRLMTFYYSTFFNSMSLAGGFYRIGAPQIKTLPIAMTKDEALIEIVEKKVSEIQELMLTKTAEDPEVIKLNKDLDEIVYKIYGLTAKEIQIVEE